jgi:hypothetical protein
MTTTEPITEPNEITEPVTETAAAAELTETKKANCFLGLYFPKTLKQKVAEASKSERRSMSQYAVMVFEKHFANA